MLDIETFKTHVESFLNETEFGRHCSERNRDYVDNKQWTAEEEAKLRGRQQAPIVVNRCKPKVEGLKGLLIQRKTDPKGYPRTQKHEDAAHTITDGLRYVADNTNFDGTKLECADDFFVEGYCGAVVEVKQRKSEIEIQINRIPWDRIYYDPHSRKYDFSDARYLGIKAWKDVDDARARWGAKVDEALIPEAIDGETFQDRPNNWVSGNKQRPRILVAQEYYKHEGVWHVCVFSGDVFLEEPKPSPYLDEDGNPDCPIKLASCHVDRDNRRFGEVEYWIDQQDELNHRRSKGLFLLSQRQTAAQKGAIADVDGLKRELAKPDGHVEYKGDKGTFEILQTGDMAQAQFELYQDAKAELDAMGFNAQLAGERQGQLSGKAILALQSQGANELSALFVRLTDWEREIYRQVWYRIRQFWTAEKWIRVTDDEKRLRWAGFNIQITLQEQLEEVINDDSRSEFERKPIAAQYMQLMQAMQQGDPRAKALLESPVETRNDVAELDVDIILEQGLDTVTIQNEQFELLATLAQNRPEIPFTSLLRLSSLRDKDDLIKHVEEAEANRAQFAQQEAEAEAAKAEKLAQIELQKDAALQQQKIDSEERKTAATIQATNAAKEAELALKAEELRFRQQTAAIELETKRTEAMLSETATKQGNADLVAAVARLVEVQQDTSDVDALIAELNKPIKAVKVGEGEYIAEPVNG